MRHSITEILCMEPDEGLEKLQLAFGVCGIAWSGTANTASSP